MGDEEDYENDDNEEVSRLEQEVASWKSKFKTMELKKKETELALNKIKTEINSLRSVDRLWKEASKNICNNMIAVQQDFYRQMDQVLDGLAYIAKVEERIVTNTQHLKQIRTIIAAYQSKIAMQEEKITSLNNKVKQLTIEIQDKNAKIERLSEGLEDEVERVCRPMRDKLSDAMTAIMKEKAARAQERRHLADLWPSEHLLPTILMKYRSQSEEERQRRILISQQQNAAMALSLEIRANVAESKRWEIKYDDYGRPFYQHSKTGETSWTQPEIMSYKPPEGRDEMGNLIINEDNDSNNWTILCDNKGQTYYKKKTAPGSTEEIISYNPPFLYKKLPLGKSREKIVSEAAEVVLRYINEKISKHTAIKKKKLEQLENPLTHEEQAKREKQLKNLSPEERQALDTELTEEGESIDLSLFQYDIQTVELLAWMNTEDRAKLEKDCENFRAEKRAFLRESKVRDLDEALYEGKTLAEVAVHDLSDDNLQELIEKLALREEKLEKILARVRNNLKDFSLVFMERMATQEELKQQVYKQQKELEEKEKKMLLRRIEEEKKKLLQEQQMKDARDHQSSRRRRRKGKKRRSKRASTAEQEENLQDQPEENDETEDDHGAVDENDANYDQDIEDGVIEDDDDPHDLDNEHTGVKPRSRPQSATSNRSRPRSGASNRTGSRPASSNNSHSSKKRKQREITSDSRNNSGNNFEVEDGSSKKRIHLDETAAIQEEGDVNQEAVEELQEEDIENNNEREDENAEAGNEEKKKDENNLDDTMLPEEDEETRAQTALEQQINKKYDLDYELHKLEESVEKLFGDLLPESNESNLTMTMPDLSAQLSNFAIFCGFVSKRPGDYPYDENSQDEYSMIYDMLSKDNADETDETGQQSAEDKMIMQRIMKKMNLKPNNPVKSTKLSADDEWLTCNFFIHCTEEHINRHQEKQLRAYQASTMGVLPLGLAKTNSPIAKSNIDNVNQAQQISGQDGVQESKSPDIVDVSSLFGSHLINRVTSLREEERHFTSSTREIEDCGAQMLLYEQWKARQLYQDVVKYALEREALHTHLKHRYQAYNGNRPVEERKEYQSSQKERGAENRPFSGASGFSEEKAGLEEQRSESSYSTENPYFHALERRYYYPPEVQLRFSKVEFELSDPLFKQSHSLFSLQLFMKNWAQKTSTSAVMPTLKKLVWPDFQCAREIAVNDLQLQELIVELIEENSETGEILVIAQGSLDFARSIFPNFQREIRYEIPLQLNKSTRARASLVNHLPEIDADDHEAQRQRKKQVAVLSNNDSNLLGVLRLDAIAAMNETPEFQRTQRVYYPEEYQLLAHDRVELLLPKHRSRRVNVRLMDAIEVFVKEKQSSNENAERERDLWSKLVEQLRGDYNIFFNASSFLQKSSTEDVDRSQSESAKVQRENELHVEDLYSVSAASDPGKQLHQSIKALSKRIPNFQNLRAFMIKKLKLHRSQVVLSAKEVERRRILLKSLLREKKEQIQRQFLEAKSQHVKIADEVEKVQEEVLKCTKTVADHSKPIPPPNEPNFPAFPPLPYVPPIPTSGGLDHRGKKKKPLSANDLKLMLDRIVDGGLDGLERWPFPENNFPSQAQVLKLSKARDDRNAILDRKRAQEQTARDKIIEIYQSDYEQWQNNEERRKEDLAFAKKISRKTYLRYDAAMQKLARYEKECEGIELDMKSFQDLATCHQICAEKYETYRLKQYLERQRIEQSITDLKKRLKQVLDARRHLMLLPQSTLAPHGKYSERDALEFSRVTSQCEELLEYLKLEVFEVKQLIIQEGLRLRMLIAEEYKLVQNELMRTNVSIEIAKQRNAFDKILMRYKFEVNNLHRDMLTLQLKEAELDEEGLETVDDLGERYLENKDWASLSANIAKCQRLIDLGSAKIHTTEGFSRSAGVSQKLLVESLWYQFGYAYMNSMRESWTETAEYQRLRHFYEENAAFVVQVQSFLREQEESHRRAAEEERQKQALLLKQVEQGIAVQERELELVKTNAVTTLHSVRKHLDEYRRENSEKVHRLENSLVEKTKECQKVREENLAMQMLNQEKMKVLWAFIHTLQTALQQMSAKMEIVVEEREQIVIKSKLLADRTKHQLLAERKHCANLLFIIHSQTGFINYLKQIIAKITKENARVMNQQRAEKNKLRRDLWEHIFCFTRLCTDVDALFEFFAARLANLAGSRASINDALGDNNAAMVLAALCKSPKPIIRKYAARAIGAMGWNSFVETRILLWDCLMYWKAYKQKVLEREYQEFSSSLQKYTESGKYDAILNIQGEVEEEFMPSGSIGLRSMIKQRRQWALRATRRMEGPNYKNQKLLNVKDGVLSSLLEICFAMTLPTAPTSTSAGDSQQDDQSQKTASKGSKFKSAKEILDKPDVRPEQKLDWEITRNAALAISISSYEPSNHQDMLANPFCIEMVMKLCRADDAEIQAHAAITISNLCFKNEDAQQIFGQKHQVIPLLLNMLEYTVVDVVEAASAALANLTSYCDANCRAVFEHQGIERMIQLLTSFYTENLLDLDQNDEVHSNISEVLANVSRYNTHETIAHFDSRAIDALVLLCASNNKQVRRHVCLVLGNIAQSETCRYNIGMQGGIEALFLTLEENRQQTAVAGRPNSKYANNFAETDVTMQANALWALSNLMWHPPNQERAGRFMREIIRFFGADTEALQINSSILLANVLYYNTANRVRFLETDGAMELLLDYIVRRTSVPMVESCLRAMLSLSFMDSISMWLGGKDSGAQDGEYIRLFVSFLKPPFYSRLALRYALEILLNMCLHHQNRRKFHDLGAIDVLVPLHADHEEHVRQLSVQIIDHLKDITPAEVLARTRQDIGLEEMVKLVSSEDVLVRAAAAESIGEEVWSKAEFQDRAQEIGAVDSLLAIVKNYHEPVQSLLPALWALRNLLHHHPNNQMQFGYRDGVALLAQVVRRGLTGMYMNQTEKVFEAVVACMIAAVTKEDRNSRRLVMVALDAILQLSTNPQLYQPQSLSAAATNSPNKSNQSSPLKRQAANAFGSNSFYKLHTSKDPFVATAIRSESIQALVHSLLLLLGPYNYVVCKNCGRKQDLHGTSCYNCGHRLLVEVEDTQILRRLSLPNINPLQSGELQQQLANAAGEDTTQMKSSTSPNKRRKNL